MDAGDRERPAPLSPERWAVVPGPDLPKIRKRERISEVALTRAMEDISRLRFVEPRRGRDARFTKAGAREGWVCRVGERNARTGKQGGFRAVLARPASSHYHPLRPVPTREVARRVKDAGASRSTVRSTRKGPHRAIARLAPCRLTEAEHQYRESCGVSRNSFDTLTRGDLRQRSRDRKLGRVAF